MKNWYKQVSVRRRAARAGTEQDHTDSQFGRQLEQNRERIRNKWHNRIMTGTSEKYFPWPAQDQTKIRRMERHAHAEHNEAQQPCRVRD